MAVSFDEFVGRGENSGLGRRRIWLQPQLIRGCVDESELRLSLPGSGRGKEEEKFLGVGLSAALVNVPIAAMIRSRDRLVAA